MNVWNSLPFVRLLIAFVAGIIIGIQIPGASEFSWFLLIIPVVAFLIIQNKFGSNYQFRFLKGIPIILFFLLFGIKLVQLHTPINYDNHFSKKVEDIYLVKIAEPPKSKLNTFKIIAEVIEVKHKQKWLSTQGKLLIYIAKDSASNKLKYGDLILCKAKIISTPTPKNPFEFDYKKYLGFHQIYHQTYLNRQNWFSIGKSQTNQILAFSYQLRNYLLQLISSNNITGDEYAIGSALILGYEDNLSNEVIGSFAATGALHVLSVSGLHVGIVFLVINFLLKYLGESKTAKIARFLVSLLGLWAYALITGLSPSVWRAAAMFSLIALGKFYKKDISTFNIIGCSAFILLCINPFMITEVGFQLSYLAVIGIVTLHQKFYDLVSIKNKILDNIWSISCVSVAAQIVTFPLGLLYFHQFPNYFLFSNLVVIPLSTIILYGGILLLTVAKIPVAGALIAKGLYYLLWLLKSSVSLFENLPYALVEGISISTLDTFVIYGILIGGYCYWVYKKIVFVQLSLLLGICFFSLQIFEKINHKSQEKIVIYAINKHVAIDFIAGQNNVLIADSLLLNNKDKMRFHLIPNWNNLGLSEPKSYTWSDTKSLRTSFLSSKGNYLFYKNKIILSTANPIEQLNQLIYKPEIVMLSFVNKAQFKTLFQLFPSAVFICDGTISAYLYQKLKSKNPKLNLHSVLKEGAITIKV
jgi:competence protein ComEC